MLTRQQLEEIEDKTLAPYAMKSRDSLGREYKENAHDYRTCYQRDRDRIVHSEAFRNLEYKTQVFVIFEGDYYRTRLTHTIEVSQIARTIGRSLQLNEDLIEAIALAHDLGHAPFGHAGEKALTAIMKTQKFGSFNHNFRSFQIVTKFEKRYPDFDGLNLTKEVLIGILKHETCYDKKSEIAKYKNLGTTLEAHVVDMADSIAYLSHDIDDGLTSGCITEEDLMESALWSKSIKRINPKLKSHYTKSMLKYQIVRFLIDMQVSDLLNNSYSTLKINKFKSANEFKKFHVKNPKRRIIDFSDGMTKDRLHLQDILEKKLYHHYRVERMTEKATRIINEIFDVYAKNPRQLPYQVFDPVKDFTNKIKYEIICNYIANMTDRFALDEHKKLFNPYQKV